jgi:EmrB/QacA subfamily drug resistance transporter
MANSVVGKKSTLAIVAASTFLTPFNSASINVALPTIGKEFAMDAVTMGWVATAYLLASGVFLIPFGRWADIWGRRKIYQFGAIAILLGSLFTVLAPSSGWLIGARGFTGLGAAMILATGVAILSAVYPVEERGKALGINAGALHLGLTMGPLAGGFMIQSWGWRSIFISVVPYCLLLLLATTLVWRREWADAKGDKFDWTGMLVYNIGLICLMLGFSKITFGWGQGLTAVGAILIVGFVLFENRVQSPILDMRLFRSNRMFSLSNLAGLAHYVGTFAVTLLLSLYLQNVKGLSAKQAGMVLVAQPIVMAILSPVAGKLSDKFEPRVLASIGVVFTIVPLILFALMTQASTITYIYTSLIILGFGYAFFSSPNTTAVMSSVEKKVYGVASATMGTMRMGGSSISMAITMMFFAIYLGKLRITPKDATVYVQTMTYILITFMGILLVGLVASMLRGKIHKAKTV